MRELLEKINSKKCFGYWRKVVWKTTNILFPLFKKITDNNKKIIVYDTKYEYLNKFYDELTEKGYYVKIINLLDTKHSKGWNPLKLLYHCYKNDTKDKTIELLENLANTFYFISKKNPFWAKIASNYLIGLCWC